MKRRYARGKRHEPGKMNGLEKMFDKTLGRWSHEGRIHWWAFESVKLKLADNCHVTIDFFVMMADGELRGYETKSWWEDDARVKIKVAAALFPIHFFGVRRVAGAWEFEEF